MNTPKEIIYGLVDHALTEKVMNYFPLIEACTENPCIHETYYFPEIDVLKTGGDFAFSCHTLAQVKKMNVDTLAEKVAEACRSYNHKFIDKIQVKNGYVNFTVNANLLAQIVFNEMNNVYERVY